MPLFFSSLYSFIAHPLLLLVIKMGALLVKCFLLGLLLQEGKRTQAKVPTHMWVYLILFLSCNIFIDFVWFMQLLKETVAQNLPHTLIVTITRIGWPCSTIEYISLALFLDALTKNAQSFMLSVRQKIYLSGGILFMVAQMGIIFNDFYLSLEIGPNVKLVLYQCIYFYLLAVLILSIQHARRMVRSRRIPKILTKQLNTFMAWVVAHIVFEFSAFSPFAISSTYKSAIYPFINISTILITGALYFSTRKMIGMRFLNMRTHVEIAYDINFIKKFKHVLERLAQITTFGQLNLVTSNFFEETLGIPPHTAKLYIRALDQGTPARMEHLSAAHQNTTRCVENTLMHQPHADAFKQLLYQSKILIKDELEFTNFYEHNEQLGATIDFLNAIDAAVFLPIYDKQCLIGYIIIEHATTSRILFGTAHRDEMAIFATYISAVISLLQHGNVQALMKEQKQLKEELYQKHQEVNQCKESVHSFLRSTGERKIGVLFYKNRRFSYGNQAAKELIHIDPNEEQGHTLAHELNVIAKRVNEYKSTQTLITKDANGTKIVIAGIPSLDINTVIITVYYPEIADTVQKSIAMLKDPSDWDYVLYLETTQSGQLINQLIPGSSTTLLDFKIRLLKTTLHKKAVLLDLPEEDLKSTVEMIHHLSLRSELFILQLNSPEKNHDAALKLFGINPLFGEDRYQPLLETLNNIGTLFIENIDLLSLETQQHLAEFIQYGYFKPIRSDRRIASSVRILCSTHQNLPRLTQEGHFSPALLHELIHTTVSFPSLTSLDPHELNDLMEGFVEQALHPTGTQQLKHILALNDKERARILEQHPLSLQELKERIHKTITSKALKKNLPEIITINAAQTISDPELHQAIRLGKHALKDERIMTTLWNKFKNQTKIAELLNVNRSSVNRRCKKYNLTQ